MKEMERLLTPAPWRVVEAAPAWLRVSVGWQLSATSSRPPQISERRLAVGAHQVCRSTLSRIEVTTDQYPQFASHRMHLLRISRINNL